MSNRIEVKAPMSGVFYRNPSPEEPPYVEMGTEVMKKQVLENQKTKNLLRALRML